MKNSILVAAALAALFCFVTPAQAHAQAGETFGLGLILGDPNGLSFKTGLDGGLQIDGALGFSIFDDPEFLQVHADFLWQNQLKSFDKAQMDWYFGVGPKLAAFLDGGDIWLGARAPLGLDFLFTNVPLDLFVEIAAGLWIIQDVDFDLDAAVGLRYWF